MSIALACVNLKGGVGKTAIAVNFAAYCGSAGKRALLVDLDPQTNATFCCMALEDWKEHAANKGTVADILGIRRHTSAEDRVKTAHEIIRPAVFPNVDLIPSHLELFTIDLDLAGATARETRLKRALEPVAVNYDIIIFDCPPNLTLPTQNALAASSHFVIPVSPDFLSGIGVGLLINRISLFSADMEHTLKLAGIIVSRVGRPAEHRTSIITGLRQRFGTDVLQGEIREFAAVSEAAAKNKPIFEMGNRDAALDFSKVSKDLFNRVGLTT